MYADDAEEEEDPAAQQYRQQQEQQLQYGRRQPEQLAAAGPGVGVRVNRYGSVDIRGNGGAASAEGCVCVAAAESHLRGNAERAFNDFDCNICNMTELPTNFLHIFIMIASRHETVGSVVTKFCCRRTRTPTKTSSRSARSTRRRASVGRIRAARRFTSIGMALSPSHHHAPKEFTIQRRRRRRRRRGGSNSNRRRTTLRRLPGCRLGSTRRKRGELAREEREKEREYTCGAYCRTPKTGCICVSTPLPGLAHSSSSLTSVSLIQLFRTVTSIDRITFSYRYVLHLAFESFRSTIDSHARDTCARLKLESPSCSFIINKINLKLRRSKNLLGEIMVRPPLTHAAGHAARCITRSPHPRSSPRPSSPALSRRYPALSRSLSRTTTCTSFITGKRNSAGRSGGDARQHAGARRVLSPHDVGAGTSVHQKRRPLRVAVAQARSGDERSHRRAARSVR